MENIENVIQKIDAVIDTIWNEHLGESPVAIDIIPEDKKDCDTSVSCVHILGGWDGSASIEIERDLIVEMAKNIFQKDPEKEDLKSIIKEFTNVTGGNIKGLLGHECILSTPNYSENKDFNYRVPDSKEMIKRIYEIKNGYFIVRVHKSSLDLGKEIKELIN